MLHGVMRCWCRGVGSPQKKSREKKRMSYRLSLLRLQLSNVKATVTHQKCTIISNFNFDTLCVELGPYCSFLAKQTQRIMVMCAINWSLIGMKPFSYAIHQHSEKRIDIHCKVTFGFKHSFPPQGY